MLKIENVSYSYDGVRSILNDVSCSLGTSDCVTLIGHNGAGKSTFLDLIGGRCIPQQGSIFLEGKDITFWTEKERASMIGCLFQDPSLNTAPSMTVRENILLTLSKGRFPRMSRHEVSKKILQDLQDFLPFELEPLLDSSAWNLSGGERQLLSFALLVKTRPALLLLDEPTAALDTNAATELLKRVTRTDIPIILITHNPIIAQYVGNKLWCIEQGSLRYEYGPEKVDMPIQDLMKEIDVEVLMS